MINFLDNNFYSISELNQALGNNSVGIFAKSITNYIYFDGLVTLVKADIDNLEIVEANFNSNIINSLAVSNVLSNPTKYNHQQTFNFRGFFEFALSDRRSLCLCPTEYCLIDGVKPKLNVEYYFPIDLNNIMMALDRKLMDDTPITHAELYTWGIRSELKQPMFYLLNIYFLESKIIDFAARKNISIQTIAEIEKTKAIRRHKEAKKAATAPKRFRKRIKTTPPPEATSPEKNKNSTQPHTNHSAHDGTTGNDVLSKALASVQRQTAYIKLISATLNSMNESHHKISVDSIENGIMTYLYNSGENIDIIYEVQTDKILLSDGNELETARVKAAIKNLLNKIKLRPKLPNCL